MSVVAAVYSFYALIWLTRRKLQTTCGQYSHRPLGLLCSVLGAPHVRRCTLVASYDASVQFPVPYDFKAWHLSVMADARIQRSRGQGVPTPLKNQKAIGFYSNTDPDPLKSHKATNVGPSSTSQHWLADDCPLLVY